MGIISSVYKPSVAAGSRALSRGLHLALTGPTCQVVDLYTCKLEKVHHLPIEIL